MKRQEVRQAVFAGAIQPEYANLALAVADADPVFAEYRQTGEH